MEGFASLQGTAPTCSWSAPAPMLLLLVRAVIAYWQRLAGAQIRRRSSSAIGPEYAGALGVLQPPRRRPSSFALEAKTSSRRRPMGRVHPGPASLVLDPGDFPLLAGDPFRPRTCFISRVGIGVFLWIRPQQHPAIGLR